MALAALGLCFVPLFNLLGYEASLALAVLVSLAGVHLGAAAVVRRRALRAPSEVAADQARPTLAVARCYARAAGAALLCLALPLLLLLANGLRVRNCAPLAGLGFFALLPGGSALCAAALGVGCALVLRRRAGWFGLGWIVVSLLWAGWRFLSTPAVYAHDPFFGYFPGALYDEEVAVRAPLLWARLTHTAWAAAGLGLCALLLDGGALRLRLSALRGRGLPVVLCLLAAAGGLHGRRRELGVSRDAAAVEQVLTQERRTEHFVLRYAPGGAVAREIDLIASEHELRYRQLTATLGITPTWPRTPWSRLLSLDNRHVTDTDQPVVSYLFESDRQKRELMGAAGTYIAKPWRREMYLQHLPWPHPVLKHELAHIFLGQAGDRLLHLSGHGVIPSQGMIEGFAVAADWPGGKLTGHQAVKALRESRLEPPLLAVFGLRFLTVASGRAYTVAGSFCKYLLDVHGPGPLLRVYKEGGDAAAFSRVYGVPFAELAGRWRLFIDGQQVPAPEREVERERQRRPAVFHKVCAHDIALRRQRAREAAGRGAWDEALLVQRSVCQDDQGEPRYQLELIDLLLEAGREADALALTQRLLGEPGLTQALRGRVLHQRGDLLWGAGDAAAAQAAYTEARSLPQDEAAVRLLTAKLLALSLPAGAGDSPGRLLMEVLAGRQVAPALRNVPRGLRPGVQDAALDVYALTRAVALLPDLGLAHYLLGRHLYNHGGYDEAVPVLRAALAKGLPDDRPHGDGRFAAQAGRLLGQCLLRNGRAAEALQVFTGLRDRLPAHEAGQRLELSDWIARAADWR